MPDACDGVVGQAVKSLAGFVGGMLSYVLPVRMADDPGGAHAASVIAVGRIGSHPLLAECAARGLIEVPQNEQGYAIWVGPSPFEEGAQLIAIAGYDPAGVLYGCMDFCNTYCGSVLYRRGNWWKGDFFDDPLSRRLPPWRTRAVPAVKTRAIWTWGHVIYDYRRFLRNMARLRLNEIVIWNDRVPLNADEVVECAHRWGIRVIWGFAWGWSTDCAATLAQWNADSLARLREQVLRTYEEEYAPVGGDGIYFQSFTELSADEVGGVSVAERVTEVVNDVAGALLARHPALHIQFGLHADSVKTRLDAIRRVDERVTIVWENCGAFPFSYYADDVADFEETLALTERLLTLRGEGERFGAVLKGMTKLDWTAFEHFSERYILGERTEQFLARRQAAKEPLWRRIESGWLRRAELARRLIAAVAAKGRDPLVEALIEDGMFENEIRLPAALYAAMLWTPETETGELLETVSQYPCVSSSVR